MKRLTRPDSVRVWKHLEEEWERIERDRPSGKEEAEIIRHRLGIEVSPASVLSIVRDMKRKWPNTAPRRFIDPNVRTVVRQLAILLADAAMEPENDFADLLRLCALTTEPEEPVDCCQDVTETAGFVGAMDGPDPG